LREVPRGECGGCARRSPTSTAEYLPECVKVAELAKVRKPKLIVAGASAYSRVIDWKRFRHIADEVGALLMADMAHYAGLVAAGLYPSPVGIADFTTTTTLRS